MKKVVFNNLTVTFENRVAKINGEIDETQSSFEQNEIKELVAAILQNLTSVGDMHGDPITTNVTIENNSISGQQEKI